MGDRLAQCGSAVHVEDCRIPTGAGLMRLVLVRPGGSNGVATIVHRVGGAHDFVDARLVRGATGERDDEAVGHREAGMVECGEIRGLAAVGGIRVLEPRVRGDSCGHDLMVPPLPSVSHPCNHVLFACSVARVRVLALGEVAHEGRAR